MVLYPSWLSILFYNRFDLKVMVRSYVQLSKSRWKQLGPILQLAQLHDSVFTWLPKVIMKIIQWDKRIRHSSRPFHVFLFSFLYLLFLFWLKMSCKYNIYEVYLTMVKIVYILDYCIHEYPLIYCIHIVILVSPTETSLQLNFHSRESIGTSLVNCSQLAKLKKIIPLMLLHCHEMYTAVGVKKNAVISEKSRFL